MKPTIQITVLLPDFSRPQEWKLRIPAMTPTDAAEYVFHLSNCPPSALSEAHKAVLREFPRAGIRSVSVGDVLIIEDHQRDAIRHIATVDRIGFKFH